MDVRLKRVYEAPSDGDGQRILVDRLWPRGLTKEAAQIDVWLKNVAPSHELRKMIHNDPSRWEEFVMQYRSELVGSPDASSSIKQLRDLASVSTVTLVFSAKSTDRNNATVLRDVLLQGDWS